MKQLMSTRFASMAVIGAFTLGLLTATAVNALSATQTDEIGLPVVQGTPPATVITEDMPGWDCATMGNMICGTPEVTPEGWLADPYLRCLEGMDALMLAPELCEPLADPR